MNARVRRVLYALPLIAILPLTMGAAIPGCGSASVSVHGHLSPGGRAAACANAPVSAPACDTGGGGAPPAGNGTGCHTNWEGIQVDNEGNSNDCPQNSSGSSGSSGGGGSSNSGDQPCPPGSLGAETGEPC